jgi:hypothetical protein
LLICIWTCGLTNTASLEAAAALGTTGLGGATKSERGICVVNSAKS